MLLNKHFIAVSLFVNYMYLSIIKLKYTAIKSIFGWHGEANVAHRASIHRQSTIEKCTPP